MLIANNHAEVYLMNYNNEDLTSIKATVNGDVAYKEEFYLKQVSKERDEENVMFSNKITPWLICAISFVTLVRTFVGCDNKVTVIIKNDKTTLSKQQKNTPILVSGRDTLFLNYEVRHTKIIDSSITTK